MKDKIITELSGVLLSVLFILPFAVFIIIVLKNESMQLKGVLIGIVSIIMLLRVKDIEEKSKIRRIKRGK